MELCAFFVAGEMMDWPLLMDFLSKLCISLLPDRTSSHHQENNNKKNSNKNKKKKKRKTTAVPHMLMYQWQKLSLPAGSMDPSLRLAIFGRLRRLLGPFWCLSALLSDFMSVSELFLPFFFCLPFYLRLHPVLKGSRWDLLGCGFSEGSCGGILGVVVRFWKGL